MTTGRGWRNPALIAVALSCAYLNSFWGTFQFDDFNVIVENPVVHSFAAWWADLGRGIRPLLKLTYTINWTLAPGEPLSFHVLNFAIHVAATMLVYALARTMIAGTNADAARRLQASSAALIAALFFGLHPVQTEAVTYISGRSSSLMALLYLGGFGCYVWGSRSAGAARTLRRSGLSPLLFCLALATKESAITFPAALLLWELVQQGRFDVKLVFRRQALHWALWLGGLLWLWLHPVYAGRLVPDLQPASVYATALTQIDAISYLVFRLFVVYPLNIDPDLRTLSSWSAVLVLEAALLLGALSAALLTLRTRPWWSFGIFWFFLQLMPTNSLLPRLDLANERQLYLASFGLFVALGAEIEKWRARQVENPRWIALVAAGLMMLLAAAVVLRNSDYRSEIRLWEQTARHSPAKARAFNNLGFAYSAQGCVARAEAAYEQALRLNPNYEVARANLSSLRERYTHSSAAGAAVAYTGVCLPV